MKTQIIRYANTNSERIAPLALISKLINVKEYERSLLLAAAFLHLLLHEDFVVSLVAACTDSISLLLVLRRYGVLLRFRFLLHLLLQTSSRGAEAEFRTDVSLPTLFHKQVQLHRRSGVFNLREKFKRISTDKVVKRILNSRVVSSQLDLPNRARLPECASSTVVL